jgi:hypothetical protein
VKVFILAGQSNMEGRAKVSLMDYQAKQPATAPLFAPFPKEETENHSRRYQETVRRFLS